MPRPIRARSTWRQFERRRRRAEKKRPAGVGAVSVYGMGRFPVTLVQRAVDKVAGHGGGNSRIHCYERVTIESKGITRLTTADVGFMSPQVTHRRGIDGESQSKVVISQVARFPEGTLGRSDAHDVCQRVASVTICTRRSMKNGAAPTASPMRFGVIST
jgi:predicted ThiF/HesA family dinucleotide-utilizing enzyme